MCDSGGLCGIECHGDDVYNLDLCERRGSKEIKRECEKAYVVKLESCETTAKAKVNGKRPEE